MSYQVVSRGGRLYYVPAALEVPVEQKADARPAIVEGDLTQITFARTWDDVPPPAPPIGAVAAERVSQEEEPVVEAPPSARDGMRRRR